jgi:hypothetical protein
MVAGMDRQRIGLWLTFIFSLLVVVGMAVQVYLIATYAFGPVTEGGQDAIDLHKDLGMAVHGGYILTFLAALLATWPNWRATALSFSLAVLGTIQAFLAGGDMSLGVHALHGAFVPVVFVIAVLIMWRTYNALGLPARSRHLTG